MCESSRNLKRHTDDVAAAVAAVAVKPNKSRSIYMIRGYRALGFGEIAASYGEAIMRRA